MKPEIQVKQMRDMSAAIKQAFKALERQDVLIGIPEDKDAREDDFGNAAIAYVQENGSAANNIPARPFLKPGITNYLPQAVVQLRDAAKHAMQGNVAAINQKLGKIGTEAASSVKAVFTANDWAPLSEQTLKARVAQQARVDKATGKKKKRPVARPNPLINTGQLRRAVTYVIRER